MRTLVTCTAAALLLAACDPSESPTPTPPVETSPMSGTYQVTSRFALPAADLAPGPLGDALGVVHDLAENPAGALLDLAETSGVPAVEELRLVVPDTLEGQLEEWMNGYLESATVDGVHPVDRIRELDGVVRSVLVDWELRSTLTLAGDDGVHEPVALVFDVSDDEPLVVPVSATAPVTRGTHVKASASWPDGPAGAARVAIGEHGMGVPFGQYAWGAASTLLEARYGTADARAVLGTLVDCDALGASVASRCLGPVCVGHAAEIAKVCAAGLDEAAEQLEARVLALDYHAIYLSAGVATAEGATADATGAIQAERLTGGAWTATVDLGEGPVETTSATFAAVRE